MFNGLLRLLSICLLGLFLFWLVMSTAFPRVAVQQQAQNVTLTSQSPLSVASSDLATDRLDQILLKQWELQGLQPSKKAEELLILRRLSLALHGTVPSLEEIRRYQTDAAPHKVERWTQQMLQDPRFAAYWSERLSRVFVGTQREPFIIFRRDRFKDWIASQLQKNRSYRDWVVEIISDHGLWTGDPATNFITHAVNDGQADVNKLAGRTMRAVLGQRMDCAECHDHPFADWKQRDFEGIAAYFGQVKLTAFGIEDDPGRHFEVLDSQTQQKRIVQPAVPFGDSWLPTEGTRRTQLAVWCTSPDNRRFARATVNRVWGLMFGKAWSEGAPYFTAVDDLPDPEMAGEPGILDLLADDFVEHNYDLHRLILTITTSQAFCRSSVSTIDDDQLLQEHIDHWAVFPLVRLRPEQVVGAMLQATSLKTVDQNSALLTRTIRFFRELDFVQEYGDLGEDELQERSGTIPQALLRMNGKLVQETTQPNPFNATPRIAMAAGSVEKSIETTFLVCLSRLPTPQESEYFVTAWQNNDSRKPSERVQDMYWMLFNSPEFSWNH